MKLLRVGYLSAVLAGGLLVLSCRCFLLVGESNKLKAEIFEFQQFVENQQSQIMAKRQQLQAQQEKLSKGSAIGETVGPAVLKDIVALAEKPANARLRELLQKHGVRVNSSPPASTEQTGRQPVRKGGN